MNIITQMKIRSNNILNFSRTLLSKKFSANEYNNKISARPFSQLFKLNRRKHLFAYFHIFFAYFSLLFVRFNFDMYMF